MEIRPQAKADTEAIAAWRYPGRYSTYDVGDVAEIDASANGWAVTHEDELVGYCSFGASARVPEIEAEEGALDVGYGMRPDLMGRGLGRAFVAAILDFGVKEFSPQRLRVHILSWNERSRKVAAALGFEEERIAPSSQGDFVVMVWSPQSPDA
jgi:RimJ/RimL family protein N-acetyltransferase